MICLAIVRVMLLPSLSSLAVGARMNISIWQMRHPKGLGRTGEEASNGVLGS